MFRVLIISLLLIPLIFCYGEDKLKSGIDKANFDLTVKPQDDFYQYVNGTWLKNTEIPADRSRFGVFGYLRDEAEKNLRTIIEESANAENKVEGSEEQKVGDFYRSFMDSSLIEELGIKAIEKEIAAINGIKSKDELADLMAHFIKIGVQRPFSYWVNQDLKESTKYISYLNQSGLSLPDRDYYFKKDEKFVEIRNKFEKYIEDLFNLAGVKESAKKAKRILEMESEIAKEHWTRVENRDRNKTYNKYEILNLAKENSNFNWVRYFKAAGLGEETEIIVRQPSYVKAFNKLFQEVSVEDWKSYFLLKLIDTSAPYMSKNFVDLEFDFYSKTLRGVEQIRPRWKRAVRITNGSLGEVVSQVYVKKHFKPEAKKRMVQLVENLRKSYKRRIEQLDWMDEETKKEALDKLAKFRPKIGYPDKWKDYSKLMVKKDDLIGNVSLSNQVEYNRMISKLGKPIDRDEWFMTAQTVNAYYNPPMNEVVFPAAILQPPFFNMEADDAVNYGAIGAAIGHEMTHGFDDQGRKSDGEGNLRDWWTEEDNTKFIERAQVMVNQYNKFSPIDTMHVNGQLTLGENIGDLGGLTIAYYAYLMSLGNKEAPVIDGFTGEQRVFLGWAQVWANKYKDEARRQQLLTDPHSPGEYRCNGVVSNLPEFYKAFDVKEGDPMYRSENIRVKIW